MTLSKPRFTSSPLAQATVVLTGGGGFIGSHLVDRLLSIGATVLIIDNFITGNRDNLSHLAGHPRVELFEHDLSTSSQKLFTHITQKYPLIDYLFHFASPASPRGYIDNPITTLKVNSFGTFALAEWALKTGAIFVYASTSEAYGNPQVHPQPETYWGHVNPVGVRSSYDVSKRFGETILTTFKRQFDLDTRIVRIFNTYGPRMHPEDGRVIPNFIMQALYNKPLTVHGDGRQTRSFCYVDDLVEYIIRVALTGQARGEIINIGNPDEYTMLAFAKLIITLTKSRSQITFIKRPGDDPDRRRPDITKAKKILHFTPQIALKLGLQRTIHYFRQLK
jgi:nucleoside-diphosphate-sugar epimerase